MSPAEKETCISENRRFFQDIISRQPSPPEMEMYPYPREIIGIGSGVSVCSRILRSGPFFVDFGGLLEVGKKIGAGGQAEIFEALFDGKKGLRKDNIPGYKRYVLKVFRLKQSEWFRQAWAQESKRKHMESIKSERPRDVWYCEVQKCTLLKDGQFAFVMERYWGDLRKAIDKQILKDKTHLRPPFPLRISIRIMHLIACGMRALHDKGILHRDLKAENVLLGNDIEGVIKNGHKLFCDVADFESADGVMGTRFWRAPEVLRILRSKAADKHADPTVWTPKVDVYAYAMTCYEVLSGCIPFQNRSHTDYNIGDERPLLPDYVDVEIQELLRECWNSDPWKRPSFESICRELEEYALGKGKDFLSLAQDGSDDEAQQWPELRSPFWNLIVNTQLPETGAS